VVHQSVRVDGLDLDRGINREAAAVAPLGYVLRVILVEIALTDKPAKLPVAEPAPGPTRRRLRPQDARNDVVAVDDPDEHLVLLNKGDAFLLLDHPEDYLD